MSVLGYCWPQSVVAGDEVDLHLSGDGTTRLAVEVVRDGTEPTVVWRSEQSVVAGDQLVAEDVPEEGCVWAPTVLVRVGDWPTGMYVVQVDGAPIGAWFVVRPTVNTPGASLLKLSTNTWNAYNDVGGRNLYTGGVIVSPQRPLGAGFLAKDHERGERVVDAVDDFFTYTVERELSLWHGMSGWAGQELRFVRWAERNGVVLDYCIDADLDAEVHPDTASALLADAGRADGRRLLLSVGHDEYWTWGMRDAVEGFVAAGGNVAFLSGNTSYWQVRLEDHDRRMIAWKHRYREDPVMGTDRQDRVTSMWSDPLTGRPESAMTGVTFTRGGYHRVHLSSPRGAGGYEVHRHGHWVFDGTELRRGDLFGTESRVVGYECDGTELAMVDGLPAPSTPRTPGTPDGLLVLATSPATGFDELTTPLPVEEGAEYELAFHADRLLGDRSTAAQDRLRHGHAVMATWAHPSGGTVVTVGCTEWAYGLEQDPATSDGSPDATVERITRNLLDRLA